MEAGRSMGKTNPLNDHDLKEFVALEKIKPETEKSWNITVGEALEPTFDLSVKNPNKPEKAPLREPVLILEEMQVLDEETNEILGTLNELIV